MEILEATKSPSNKMRIMYGSNLNFERFNNYFSNLLRKGLVEKLNGSDGKNKFKITRRGRILLDALKKAEALLSCEEH